MGNSPPTGGLLLGKGEHTYQANIRGSSASLMFTGREVFHEDADGVKIMRESWKMTYKVGMSTCDFVLCKTLNFDCLFDDCEWEGLEIKILDEVHGLRSSCECFEVTVLIAEAGLLSHIYEPCMNLRIAKNLTRATNEYGVTKVTICDIYGSGTRKGLVVREWKTKSTDKRPYMGTVTHYYVDDENGEDVGLSVAVKKIRSCNGKIEFAVEGPEQHPADALVFMIKQVLKTGTWKPTLCLHCANKYVPERLSETESDIDNSHVPPSHGFRRNGGGLVVNDGKFKGNNNANAFIKNFFYGRKR